MKIKKGFVLKDICGESIIVAEGKENIDFTKIISMNESSAFLWESVMDKEFDAETLKHLLCEEYDVDDATAENDAKALLDSWIEAEIVE
ncbi:PqqD family protein [Leyella stercorea]|uniref:PqqD family protein n=1 Tax=Leyella stercorea TaxID=363265 RepID=UPI001F233DA2|nr:PqqD family protein [Leyella stercorea]MCF2615270.1 PqqD family protein [Leyella stercorea]